LEPKIERVYTIKMKDGSSEMVTARDSTRSAIGLWSWSVKQMTEQVLHFREQSILSSAISSMKEVIVNAETGERIEEG
jgi:hypothetical protein